MTLESCYSKGSTFGSPGVAESSYDANRMFLGHHVESELQEFQSAEATFSYADSWVATAASRLRKTTGMPRANLPPSIPRPIRLPPKTSTHSPAAISNSGTAGKKRETHYVASP